MKLDPQDALRLWNELCSPCGEHCYLSTTFGTVVLSHGLARRVDCSTYNLKNASSSKGYLKELDDVKNIIKFLRDWTDSLEASLPAKETTDAEETK